MSNIHKSIFESHTFSQQYAQCKAYEEKSKGKVKGCIGRGP